MAYLRLGNIKENFGAGGAGKGLMKCIDYILNPSKTSNQKYVGAHNFIVPDYDKGKVAFDTMVETKRLFDKEHGRQGYHFKLSFAENDDVDPELALKITEDFCEKCFKDYECLYAVHNNTNHLHSHIVINSIDMVEGMKYHYKKGDWGKTIQPLVNDICKKNNLSEIDLSMDEDFILKHKCKVYGDWKKKVITTNIFYSNKMIKMDVDECINMSATYDEFVLNMEKRGHKVADNGKYVRVLAPGRDRYCRLYILTPDKNTYTKENIVRMIEGTYMSREEVIERLHNDWNSYKTHNVGIQVTRVSVKLAIKFENISFATEKNFHNSDDVKLYQDYLNRADRELNIIKKHIRESFEERKEVLEHMDELMSLLKYFNRYKKGDSQFYKEYEKVISLYNSIKDGGYHLANLYSYKHTGDLLMQNIDEYKKHIYAEKNICSRLLSEKDDMSLGTPGITGTQRDRYRK